MTEFTTAEIEVLETALDALETKEGMEFMAFTIMGAVMMQDEDDRSEFIDKQREDYANSETEQKALRDRIVLIRAKLIQMRDKIAVRDATEHLSGG